MSLQEKILLRKIKRRQKQKLALLQLKEAEKRRKNEQRETLEDQNKGLKRLHVDHGESSKKKKKKTRDENDIDLEVSEETDPQTESDNVISGDSGPEKTKNKKETKRKKKAADSSEDKDINDKQQAAQESDDENSAEVNPQDLPASDIASSVLSSREFETIKHLISEKTYKAIVDMGLTTMTEIQARCIPLLLEGKGLMGVAKTGSGKTLAYLIPAVEFVYKVGYRIWNGTGVVILAPTRELAIQIYGELRELMKYHTHTFGLVMGGGNRKTEAKKLWNGVNILVATPGRLLDHMQNTPGFVYKNVQCLIFDEADRILDIGFKEEVKQIISLCRKEKQMIFFSATQSQKMEFLMSLGLKMKPIYVRVGDMETEATVSGLEQGYIVVPSDQRLLILFNLLRIKRKKKVMVFFSSCMSVQYHHVLFNNLNLPVMCVHGKQKQSKRISTFFQFCNATSGILLCTDIAARGLDISEVDWIIQYDPPSDPKEYIHRVGRTARGEGSTGNAALFVRLEELGFLWYLKEAKIPLKEFEFMSSKIVDIQTLVDDMVGTNYYIKMCAKEAFRGYVRAYESHRLKNVFDASTLDMAKVARSFGFKYPPAIDYNHSAKSSTKQERTRKRSDGSGYYKNRNSVPNSSSNLSGNKYPNRQARRQAMRDRGELPDRREFSR